MIQAVQGVAAAIEATSTNASGSAPAFGKMLDQAVQAVNASQQNADMQLEGLASGRQVDLHGTMIALEEANIALRAMTSVRDKLVDAYQTLWNMPI